MAGNVVMIISTLNKLFRETFIGYSLVSGLVAGILAYLLNVSMLYPVSFVLLTNFFDLLGFGMIQQKVYNRDIQLYVDTLPFYRIMQKMYSFTLALLFWSISGNWLIGVLCIMSNIGGIQDVLYYLFGRYDTNQNYTWLKWTPYGWYHKDRGLDKYEFYIQGILTFAIVIIGAIWEQQIIENLEQQITNTLRMSWTILSRIMM